MKRLIPLKGQMSQQTNVHSINTSRGYAIMGRLYLTNRSKFSWHASTSRS